MTPKRSLDPLLIPAVFVVAFMAIIALRIPFLSNVLSGEEGYFAYLLQGDRPVVSVPSGEALFIARVNGRDSFGIPQHPLFPYVFTDRILRPLFHDETRPADDWLRKTRAARLAFLITFMIGLIPLAFAGARLARGRTLSDALTPLALILFATTTPLVVGGSIQPQIDGSLGVMLTGLAAACLAFKPKQPAAGALLMVVAGYLSAIGKNEWALALFGSIGIALLAHFLVRPRAADGQRSPVTSSILLVIGLAAGTLSSYFLSPRNFIGGFDVMNRISTNHTVSLSQVFRQNLPFTWPLFGLAFLASALFVRRLRADGGVSFARTVLYLWGMSLAIGFLFVRWEGDSFPRYYIPSMIVLLYFLVAQVEDSGAADLPWRSVIALATLGVAANLSSLHRSAHQGVSITSAPGAFLAGTLDRYRKCDAQYQADRQPVIVDGAFGYYFRDDDFVSDSLGPEGAKEFLRAKLAEAAAPSRKKSHF